MGADTTNEASDLNPSPAPLALVTGASGGIGYELAKLLARDGYALLLVARDARALGQAAADCRALGSPRADALACDLSDAGAPRVLFDECARLGVAPDVLVNNAGFGANGPFDGADLPTQLAMIQVNVTAVTELTRLFLPGMLRRKRGRVLNVASTAGFLPGPGMAVYYASKAFVVSFSQAVAGETAGRGVSVCALCPGPTATNFHARAGVKNTPLFRANTLPAAVVARAGYRGLFKGKRVIVPGVKNRLMVFALRFAPRRMVTAVAQKLNAGR